jgi:hypothetical protein
VAARRIHFGIDRLRGQEHRSDRGFIREEAASIAATQVLADASVDHTELGRAAGRGPRGVQIQSLRLQIQELAALIGGELFLFEQQKFMPFFCLSFWFEQMPESRPLGRSSSVTSCSRTA